MTRLRFQPLDYAACLGFMAYAASVVVTPICLLILAEELNFGLLAGGGIEVARNTLIFVLLLLSAFVAARFGKARVLGVSSLCLAGGLAIYTFAPTYGVVLLAMGLIGTGSGMIEGLVNPLIQDLHPNDSGRYLNIINGFWSIGVLVTVLLSGELLTMGLSWRWTVAPLSLLSALSGLIFLGLADQSPPSPRQTTAQVWGHMAQTLALGRFWLFVPAMFLAGAVEGAFTFWSASYIQLHYDALPRAGAIGTACFSVGMILGRFACGWWVRQRQLGTLLLGSAIAGLGVSLIVPHVGRLEVAYFVLLLAGLSIACFWPTLQSYAADHLPVDVTVLFILLSCGGIPGLAFASWLMGLVGQWTSLHTSFFLVPLFFALLIAVLLLDRRCLRQPPPTAPPLQP